MTANLADRFGRDYSLCLIEGNIAAGKSTLTVELQTKLDEISGVETFAAIEPAGVEEGKVNPFLPLFYNEKERWSFSTQIWVLKERFRQQLRAQYHVSDKRGHALNDRSFYFDTAFALTLLERKEMTQLEFDCYAELYDLMTGFCKHPHICVWLDVSARKSFDRIRQRAEERHGRGCELGIDLEYLEHLEANMQKTLETLQRDCGVAIRHVQWGENRKDEELRRETIEDLAEFINHHVPKPRFFDHHKRLA